MKRPHEYNNNTRVKRKRTQRPVPEVPSLTLLDVRKEIRKQVATARVKSHPVQYVDIYFTGNDVSTTPKVDGICQKIIQDLEAYYLDDVEVRKTGESSSNTYNYCKVKVINCHYQLRFQQDDDVSVAVDSTNAIRALFYGSKNPTSVSNSGILDGADVDRPPDYSTVKKMYLDEMMCLHGYQLNIDTTPDFFIPGTKLIKGDIPINQVYEMKNTSVGGTDMETIDNSLYCELQSDSSAAPHPNVFGYIRTFYRLIE